MILDPVLLLPHTGEARRLLESHLDLIENYGDICLHTHRSSDDLSRIQSPEPHANVWR